MILRALQKADSISGTVSAKQKRLLAEVLKDVKVLAAAEVCRKILAPLLKVSAASAPVPSIAGDAVEIVLAVKSVSDAARIAGTVAQKSKWLVKQEQKKTVWTFSLNPDSFAAQLGRLKKYGRGEAEGVLGRALLKIKFQTGTQSSGEKVQGSGFRSVLRKGMASPSGIGLKNNIEYTKASLDKAVDEGILKSGAAMPILAAAARLARGGAKRSVNVAHPLSSRDLDLAEGEFLPVAAAVSALHANPKLRLKFTDDGFVLKLGKRPIGRFGRDLSKARLGDAVRMCARECGKYGDPSKLLDVLDADGKRKDECLKELFNDLAKHIVSHSSGPAAKAAKRLKKAAGIREHLDWSSFIKAVRAAGRDIRMLGSHPMVEGLKGAAEDLATGWSLNFLKRVRWEDDIMQGNLDWLGMVIADVLEEEIAQSSRAMTALSSTVDWLTNSMHCSLSFKYQGSEGIKVSFSPCQKIAPRKWKLELQEIVNGRAGWSAA